MRSRKSVNQREKNILCLGHVENIETCIRDNHPSLGKPVADIDTMQRMTSFSLILDHELKISMTFFLLRFTFQLVRRSIWCAVRGDGLSDEHWFVGILLPGPILEVVSHKIPWLTPF